MREEENANAEDGTVSTERLLERLLQQPTDRQATPDDDDDTATMLLRHHVPALGAFADRIKFWNGGHGGGDDDGDAALLRSKRREDRLDPLYRHLLQTPTARTVAVPLTADERARLLRLSSSSSSATAPAGSTGTTADGAATAATAAAAAAVVKQRSTLQQSVLDAVWEQERDCLLPSSGNSDDLLSHRGAFDLLPLEQAREPGCCHDGVEALLAAVAAAASAAKTTPININSSILTGWVAVVRQQHEQVDGTARSASSSEKRSSTSGAAAAAYSSFTDDPPATPQAATVLEAPASPAIHLSCGGPTQETPPPSPPRSPNSKQKHKLPPGAVEYLKAWMMHPDHVAHPYPNEAQKAEILRETGLDSLKTLNTWFVNNRKRYWRPLVEKLGIPHHDDGPAAPLAPRLPGTTADHRAAAATATASPAAASSTTTTSTPPKKVAAAATAATTPKRMKDRRKIVGGVVCQLEWYRGRDQPIEASEVIVRVLGTAVAVGSSSIRSQSPPAAADVHSPSSTVAVDEEAQSWLRLMLTALVLEQARQCGVWYAVFPSNGDRSFLMRHFRMTASVNDTLIADVHKSSARYACLRYRDERTKPSAAADGKSEAAPQEQEEQEKLSTPKQRWLVRLPTMDEARDALIPPEEDIVGGDPLLGAASARPQRGLIRKQSSQSFSVSSYLTSASQAQRAVSLSIRAVVEEDPAIEPSLKLLQINADGTEGPKVVAPQFYKEPPSLDIMRNFSLGGPPQPPPPPPEQETKSAEDDGILEELTSKQKELEALEKGFGPPVRSLLAKVVTERMEYESAEATAQREREKQVLADAQKMLERRKELDVAWQKQLEQDMDAVCEICGDGEVTPDNQILFCEACNVAVHQYCYGIDRIPEGDYYCMACRRLGRDKHKEENPHLAAIAQPLPICCELCPLRQGAFIRTDTKPFDGGTGDRWVHVVCAKWQGLNYVDSDHQDVIEDVTQLRIGFRQHEIKCELCKGERGAMNKCVGSEDCNKWYHITCARAVGTLKVTHGENCHGPVEENPWTLCCPEHSDSATLKIKKHATTVEKLILAAQEFPPEPRPPPAPRPFNQLTGPERKVLLADQDYESALIVELLYKRFKGVRCEVCDVVEDESKNLTRCVLCNVTFCSACKLDSDEMRGAYRCPSCRYTKSKKNSNENVDPPQCVACYQKGGLLREARAEPVSRRGFWAKNPKEYERSLYAKQLWVHSLCAL